MENEINYKINIKMDEENNIKYRYLYSKIWDDEKPFIICILFNPSKADLYFNDTTLDRLTFEFREKYGGFKVLNLFSIMETKLKNNILYNLKYENYNLEYITNYIEKNKDCDFFIGWGNTFEGYQENYKEEGGVRKKKIEKLFRSLEITKKVFCYRSKWGKALHPCKYDLYGKNWAYDKYFKF